MHAFILAGGFATRLWPLTERRAKPLLPIAGKPLLSWIVAGIPADIPITLSTNAAFREDFERWKHSEARPITIVIEDAGHEEQKLGALGATARWIQTMHIDDDVLLLAGDNYADFSLASVLSKRRNDAPLIVGYDIGDLALARRFGTVVLDAKGRVTSFEEKPAVPRSTIVATGWSVLPRSVLSILLSYAERRPDDIGGIFEELLRHGIDVECVVCHGIWKDIGSFASYIDLHRTVVGDRRLIDKGTMIDTASRLQGSIDIGAATRIERSTLTDCVIFGKSTIEDCVLRECIIDEGCALQGVDLTGKMLRAGTMLTRP